VDPSVGIIVPYFGLFPKSYKYWFNSAVLNDSIDFHIVTDQDVSALGTQNIFIHRMSFEELQTLAENKLGVIKKFTPYKLCDFKPAYGELFSSIVENYDFWGHCDIDMVLGDLRGEANKGGLLQKYDKVFDLGHLSLYRNTSQVNQIYKACFKGIDFWPYIRDSQVIWVFDEAYGYGMGGVNARIDIAGMRLFSSRSMFSDVDPGFEGFFDIHNSPGYPSFFSFNKKCLIRHTLIDGEVFSSNLVYAHFQKRSFKVKIFSDGMGVIVPCCWGEVISVEEAELCLKEMEGNDFKVRPFYKKWKIARSRRKKWLVLKELFRSPSSIRFVQSVL